jgi:hypothetical protein
VLTPGDAAEVTRTAVFEAGIAPMFFERSYAGGSDLVTWLDGAPLDTSGSPADIKLLMELVRDSDGAVLWSADTVSARDVDDDMVYDVVEVPVYSITPGTEVYVRLRVLPSTTLDYDISAGFTFWEDTTASAYQKMVRPRTEEKAKTGAAPSPLEVTVVPNPVTAHGELRIRVTEPGQTSVNIYDLLGRLVKQLPAFTAAHAGEYALEVDLAELPKGTYTVRIEQEKYQASSRFSIVR